MSKVLSTLIGSIALGDVQEHSRMAVQPIVSQNEPSTDYLSLAEAIENEVLQISELSEAGSVAELRATNTGGLLILIMDGAEVIGAKQNRVLNTTVLLPNGETNLSVSCVERGRWDSTPGQFSASEDLLTPTMRARKRYQVNRNLEEGSREADQDDVWQAVAEMTLRSSTPRSRTGAMRDVYQHRDSDLNAMVEQFTLVPGQVGMAVFINGELAGIEYLSQPRVFEGVYSKLLRSYALEATMEDSGETAREIDSQIAPSILSAIESVGAKSYDAVGTGQEHRISCDSVVGSALSLNDEVLHLSLQRSSEKPVPFPRSYWVKPGSLLAGCYPGDRSSAMERQKLSGLLDCGIRAVVNLMEADEVGHHGRPFAPYQDDIVQMGIERGLQIINLRKPIMDVTAPTRRYMREILDQIDGLIDMGLPVYVHCWGGRGRTGTVVGCWLARHGIAQGDQAIEHINKLRRKDPTRHKPSPQIPDQFELVRSWKEGQ